MACPYSLRNSESRLRRRQEKYPVTMQEYSAKLVEEDDNSTGQDSVSGGGEKKTECEL